MMHAPNLAPLPLSQGGRLVAVDGRTLPLQATAITADACGGLARVVVEPSTAKAVLARIRGG